MALYQTEKLLHSKRNQQQNEKQPTEWETIFANTGLTRVNIQNI